MKQPIRYFAIGLITASLLTLVIISFFGPKEVSQAESIEQMISEIESEGYHVITQAEFITLSVAHDNKRNENNQKEKAEKKKPENETTDNKPDEDKKSEKKKAKEDDKEESKKEKVEKEVHKYTLVIKENMLPSTVSQLLVDNKIIKDANEFNVFMEKNNYSARIQIGEHKVTSDMSKEELAKELMKFN